MPEPHPPSPRRPRPVDRMRLAVAEWRTDAVQRGWDTAQRWGSIGAHHRRAARFGAFGDGTIICFPWVSLYGERWMRIGSGTMVAAYCTLSVGMTDDQEMMSDPVISIGDRCLIGKGTGIVAHWGIEIGDDVFTGHHCYITDQNHGYEDLARPIGAQTMPERPVRIGSGSWLGHGSVVLPGVTIGEHVTVAAGSVVTRDVPAFSVVGGSPAKVLRHHDGDAWRAGGPTGE